MQLKSLRSSYAVAHEGVNFDFLAISAIGAHSCKIRIPFGTDVIFLLVLYYPFIFGLWCNPKHLKGNVLKKRPAHRSKGVRSSQAMAGPQSVLALHILSSCLLSSCFSTTFPALTSPRCRVMGSSFSAPYTYLFIFYHVFHTS
jgi:hypothetical protein